MHLMKHEDMTVNNEERIKCCNLMCEYGLKCSEFLYGHGWHMADVPKEQWFVFITPAFDYIRMSTAVQICPPCQLSQNEYEKSWHIETSNTSRADTYKDFKNALDYLMNEYIKCKKELRELLIREATNGYET